MRRCLNSARNVVATHGIAWLVFDNDAIDDKSRIGFGQRIELFTVLHVVAVAEQDQAVGAVAGLVLDVPVVGQLLQRDQDVVAERGGRARDVAEHGQEERVDLHVLAFGFVEHEQGDRVALLGSQAGRVAVDEIVELARDFLNAFARFLSNERAVAQRARYRGLRDPGNLGDVARCGVVELHGRHYSTIRRVCPLQLSC